MDYHTRRRHEWLGVVGKNDWKTILGGCIFLALLLATTIDWDKFHGPW